MKINKNPRCPNCGGLSQKSGFIAKVGGEAQLRFRCSKCGKTFFDTDVKSLSIPKFLTLVHAANGVEYYTCYYCGHISMLIGGAEAHFEICENRGNK